jgi:diguanylate cyclase (GGDEF)-like protein
MSVLFVVFSVFIWLYANQLSTKINEQWGKKFIEKQIMFDKYRTLSPIVQEIAIVQKLALEPSILAMAHNETDPSVFKAGIKTLEKYRTLFQDRSYFVAFTKSHNYYFNDSLNQFEKKQLRYKLLENKSDDKWFFETLKIDENYQININKDTLLGVNKVWINHLLKEDGKVIGVIGTGFDFDQFLKHSVGIEQAGVRNFYIRKDLSIQLAKDAHMIDYASITKKDGGHKTINVLISQKEDIEKIKDAMRRLVDKKSTNNIEILWIEIDNKKHLLGIAYQEEIGWFSLTIFDNNELMLIESQSIFIVLSFLFVMILVLLGSIHTKVIIKPIGRLIENMNRFRRGNMEYLPIKGSGEFVELANQFNSLTEEIYKNNETLEHKIEERTKNLLASEKKFRAIFNFTHDAVMLLDANGFLDCNNATLKVFGCRTVEEFCSCHPADLSPKIQPCGTESFLLASEHIQTAMATGYDHFEWLHQKADSKETFYADVLLSVIDFGDKKILQAVVRDESAKKIAQEEIQTLAFYDTLTSLPNRRLLGERLKIAQSISKRSHCFGAVLFIDLDNFKPLNDTYGHSIGDMLLVEVATRIKSCIRETDTASRFGGDEFIILISELNIDKEISLHLAKQIAQKIQETVSYPYFLKTVSSVDGEKIVEHNCSASIGLTLFLSHEASQDEIFHKADSAMYEAKQSGRNCICIYQEEINEIK